MRRDRRARNSLIALEFGCYDPTVLIRPRPTAVCATMSRATRTLLLVTAVFCAALLRLEMLQLNAAPALPTTAAVVQSDSISKTAPIREMLDKYCVTCHSERLKTAGLVLEKGTVNVDSV